MLSAEWNIYKFPQFELEYKRENTIATINLLPDINDFLLFSALPVPSSNTKETRKVFILDLFVAKNLENTIYCQRKIISHYIKS